MNRAGILLPALAVLLLPAATVFADDTGQTPAYGSNGSSGDTSDNSFATIGVSAGTRALDPELGISVSPYFGVRLVGADMDVEYRPTRDGVKYDGHYDFRSLSLLGDWYPWGGSFHFTAGAVYDQDRVRAQAQPNSNGVITVNNVVLLPGDQLYADGRWPHKYVPYAGFGWGNPAAHQEGIGARLDIGAMYTQSPQVTLTAVGPDAGNPVTQAGVQQEQANINHDERRVNVYPVAQLGIYYGF